MARTLMLGALFASSLTFASVRLFPQPSVLTLSPLTPELKVSEPKAKLLVATGAAAALLATPASLMLGSWVGNGSNNLLGALVPAMLIVLLVPTLAVLFAEWRAAERAAPGRFRWLPALAVALLTQLAVIAGGVLLGVNGVSGAGIALFTLADVLALPTVTTALLNWTERPPTISVPVLSGTF